MPYDADDADAGRDFEAHRAESEPGHLGPRVLNEAK